MKRSYLPSLALSLLLACGSDDPGTTGEEVDPSTDPDEDTPRVDAGAGTTGIKRDGGTGSTGGKKDAGGGVMSGGGGGNDVCESKIVPARTTPPDVLIVLDRSLSMLALRWGPSVMAVQSFTSEFETTVSFGLSLFPGPEGACSTAKLDVPLMLNNAAPISQFLGGAFPNGITPTPQALKAALGFLGDRTQSGDTKVTPAYVVLVTDGDPTCPDGEFPDPAAGTIAGATNLLNANIKTYTIGYGLQGPAKTFMDQVAVAGGSGQSHPVESPDQLSAAFKAITADLVQCDFELDEVPPDPDYVLVSIDGQTVQLDPADGWIIDGKTVTLKGGACDILKDGEPHALRASVECEPVPYL